MYRVSTSTSKQLVTLIYSVRSVNRNPFQRAFSSDSEDSNSSDWHIATLSDGTVACWHPEKPFPYENSRPIDTTELARDRKEFQDLRCRAGPDYLANEKRYGAKGPEEFVLREIFHTGITEFKLRFDSRREAIRNVCSTSKARQQAMIRAVWFGRRLFKDGLLLQDDFYNLITANVKHSKKHYLCLLEHFPVYTVGLRDQSYTPEMENKLKELGADFQRIKRGGLITFHGPGQLVAYPILNLRELYVDGQQVGVRRYVSLLEDVLIRVSSESYGLQNVGRTDDPGVWVEENRKLAAIGIQVRNGITSHGIALNCNTDLSWYNHIVACGLVNKTVTSLTNELRHDVTVAETIDPFVRAFSNVFQTEISLQSKFD